VGDRRVAHDYVFDRLGGERLIQAYRVLVSTPTRLVNDRHSIALDVRDEQDPENPLASPAQGRAAARGRLLRHSSINIDRSPW
jgi:hypothetical protein